MADAKPAVPPGPPRRRIGALRVIGDLITVLRANPLTLAGFVLVALIMGTAVLVAGVPFVSGLFTGHSVEVLPYAPNQISTAVKQGPSLAHPFGTDNVGEDIFSQVLYALPLDLFIGFAVTGFALLVGGLLGLVAGYWDSPGTVGGFSSVAILRVTDVFLAFPSLVLALAITAALGRGTFPAILAIMLSWWPYYVRLTRGEVLAVKHLPYVTAARGAGVSDLRILRRHILANILEPLTVYYTMDVGTVLITFSTINYVGIGVPLTVPEWGNQIVLYQDFLLNLPWTVAAPGLAIFITVLAFSLLGDGLRDILDPRSRRALTRSAGSASAGSEEA